VNELTFTLAKELGEEMEGSYKILIYCKDELDENEGFRAPDVTMRLNIIVKDEEEIELETIIDPDIGA
jgi:hypothetical protein